MARERLTLTIDSANDIVAIKANELLEEDKSLTEIAKILNLKDSDEVFDRLLDFYVKQF